MVKPPWLVGPTCGIDDPSEFRYRAARRDTVRRGRDCGRAPVAEFDVERLACRDRRGAADRWAGRIAHQRKATRQYALIGERGQELVGAVKRGELTLDQPVDGKPAALRQCGNALVIAHDALAGGRGVSAD